MLIARFRPNMVGCFWPVFFFADHRFKKAWQERDYTTVIEVARKSPEDVLQEDPKLLMWYDQALTRTGEDE